MKKTNIINGSTKELSVLYVEDDIYCRQETYTMLKYRFNNVDIAFDGKEALEKYNLYNTSHSIYYDIVITDINMPRMDGIELIENIYKINPNQAVIVVSAYDESHNLIKLINIGVKQFLMKPIGYDKITKVLQEITAEIVKNKEKDMISIIQLSDELSWCNVNLQLFFNSKILKLTKNETILMNLFIKNKNQLSSNEEIFQIIWNDNQHLSSTEALASIVSRLRKKIPIEIENIYALGYILHF